MKARTPATKPASEDVRRRILLVDDHPILREGLVQRINAQPDLVVCAEAPDAHTALDSIESKMPDLAIIDIALGGKSGIELIKDIKVRFPQLPMVVLSMHDERLYAERTLRAGAKAYVMKQDDPEVLLHAIRQVLAGKVHLSERIKETIVNRLGGHIKEDDASTAVDQLSDRELEIFQLMGDGFGTHEIADRLHLSIKTVASHRENIKQKLQSKDGNELERFAIHWARYSGSGNAPGIKAAATSNQIGRASCRPAARPN